MNVSARALDREAVRVSRQTIAQHSKSFALASRLLDPEARDLAAVVYTFCRRADDAIDLALPPQQPAALQALRDDVDRVFSDIPPSDPVLAEFSRAAMRTGMPRLYPDELINGMEMDVARTHYDDVDTLLLYCYRVAGTVGLMMSHVMGVFDARALASAVHLGMAMQLTNICRDVVEDWSRDRLYLPRDLLTANDGEFVCDAIDGPLPARARAPIARTVEQLLRIADRLYESGDRGLIALPLRSSFGVRAARNIYAAIGHRIRTAACDVFAGRAVVPPRTKALLVGRAAVATAVASRARLRRPAGTSVLRAGLPVIRFPDDVLPLPQGNQR